MTELDHFFEDAKQHVWWKILLEDRVKAVPTMLSIAELKMLYWLAKNVPLRDGACFVDAGCFLGGSTLALAAGLRDNPVTGTKESKIVAYDLFLASGSAYMLGLAGRGKKQGDLLVDVFLDNMGDLHPLVQAVCGDFTVAPPPDREIDILFVDVAKSWSLNQRVLTSYFPRLTPNGLLIQQDHNFHGCPWINLTMEYLSDYFDYVVDEQSSRLYRLIKPIPQEVLARNLETDLSYAEKIGFMDAAIAREQPPMPRYMSAITKAWIVRDGQGPAAARDYLVSLDLQQPWASDVPYKDAVIRAMAA